MKRILISLIVSFSVFLASAQKQNNLDTIDTRTLLKYAYMYRFGINTDVNLGKAAYIYKHLARKKNVDGMRELGKMYLKGEGIKQNKKYAYRLLRGAAECNDAKSMCILAEMYQHGNGLKQNYTKAANLYKDADALGNAQGSYGAGYLLYKGMGVKQDYAKAEKYLLKGSAKGHAGCDFLLGTYYAYGFGGEPDYNKAEKYYNKAVKNGHGWTVDMTKLNRLDSIKKLNSVTHKNWENTKKSYLKAHKLKSINSAIIPNGKWTGKIYTYDWSETRILKEENAMFDIMQEDSALSLKWSKNDSILTVSVLDEKNEDYWLKSHITKEEQAYGMIISNIKLSSLSENSLYVKLTAVSMKTRERLKPRIAVLNKVSTTAMNNVDLTYEILKIAPIHVDGNTFTVKISASKECMAKFSIYNVSGAEVFDCGSKQLNCGINEISIDAPLTKGIYVLNVECNKVRKTMKFTHL